MASQRPSGIQRRTETPQESPKTPKSPPREAQRPPRRPQSSPRRRSQRPLGISNRPPRALPRRPQEPKFTDLHYVFEWLSISRIIGFPTFEKSPRKLQGRPTTASRRPKMPPRRPQRPSRACPRRPQGPTFIHFETFLEGVSRVRVSGSGALPDGTRRTQAHSETA